MSRIFAALLLVLSCISAHQSSYGQDQWRVLPRPTTEILYKLSFLDSLRGWVCGFNGTMLKTTNGGLTWEAQETGISTDIRRVFALNDRHVWALSFVHWVDTSTWFGTKILRTTNGGTTWTNEEFPDWGEFFNSIVFKDSLNGWMGGEFGRMARTTDGGKNWIPVGVDPPSPWSLINIKFLTPDLGFAMGGRIDITGTIWKTTDGGLNWRTQGLPDPPSPEPIHDVHMVDSLHLVGITGDQDYGASMLRSRNTGEDWDYTFLNIFGEPLALSFRTETEAWVPLGFAARMMYTPDTLHTWIEMDTPGRRAIYDLVFTDSLTGYAVGDSGTILKFKPNATSVTEQNSHAPGTFTLFQNYPNPFNPATTISFDLPVRSFVTLRVFNLLGQEIRTLMNQAGEPGRHHVTFNADNLPSGVYVCRLQAGSNVQNMRMVLLR
ncbi:MAG: T9SS type A sorting domain-containing protein [Bacteroidetes bacterium]|nr:T9SS type A sorting domain-containing protein [Bacteroidota bacterium]MCW5894316.1 T9SS type A sorting domain-containing protein [Bacteroidota bacterium]